MEERIMQIRRKWRKNKANMQEAKEIKLEININGWCNNPWAKKKSLKNFWTEEIKLKNKKKQKS